MERTGDLYRPDITGRDDHTGAALCEMPEPNGKTSFQANAAVRGRISRQVARMQRDAGPGDALHVRHRGVAIEIGAMPDLFADDAEYAGGRWVLRDAR